MLARQMQGRSVGVQPRAAPAQLPRHLVPFVPAQQTVQRCSSLLTRASQVSTNDIRNGTTVEIDGVPFKVVEFLHVKPGKGSAFVRSKLKNLLNGSNKDQTFRAGEMLNVADINRREGQFTYAEGDTYVFMDNDTYEETRLPKDDWAKYLKEGTTCSLVFWNGKVISVEPPAFMDLSVVDTPPGVKGNTASGSGSKPATLETGAVINVPLFIESGELIKVDTRTDTYLSRAKE